MRVNYVYLNRMLSYKMLQKTETLNTNQFISVFSLYTVDRYFYRMWFSFITSKKSARADVVFVIAYSFVKKLINGSLRRYVESDFKTVNNCLSSYDMI